MADTVIRVENIWKQYRLGTINHGTLRADLASWWARLRGQEDPNLRIGQTRQAADAAGSPDRFWALKDVSFEVKRGEVLGIIGNNGAGKSTLLKILSRVTTPTRGEIKVRGRIASLLEVGTGFHPELTGRENIFLNGAILGMRKDEIRRKLDEIIAFAEVEKFIDTPVKRYSSGMYVRLAFAVAAHLEPEILVVDEVLAVGDAEFQKKCLGKMGDVASHGRTVLFVSHNMESVRSLCNSGIILGNGEIVDAGNVESCIEHYICNKQTVTRTNVVNFPKDENKDFYIKRIEILDENNKPKDTIRTWEKIVFRIVFHAKRPTQRGAATLQISTNTGTLLTFCSTQPDSRVSINFSEGENIVDCCFERLMLSAGHYLIGAGLAIANTEWLYNEPYAGTIEVGQADVYEAGSAPVTSRYLIPMEHKWRTQSV